MPDLRCLHADAVIAICRVSARVYVQRARDSNRWIAAPVESTMMVVLIIEITKKRGM